jgi:hypothetical protein
MQQGFRRRWLKKKKEGVDFSLADKVGTWNDDEGKRQETHMWRCSDASANNRRAVRQP